MFGEHFVVHGIPAIASALSDLQTRVTIRENSSLKDIKFIDNTRKSFGTLIKYYSKEPDYILCNLGKTLLEKLGKSVSEQSVEISLNSTVPEFGGAGSSAALSVSLVRAFSNLFNLKLDNEKISKIAYEGEKLFHGTPSGIDNTVATYGGLLWFVRSQNSKPNTIEPLNISSKAHLVIGDTRISHNVMELVAEVRRRKETEPEVYNPVFDKAKNIVFQAREFLFQGNWKKIGKLMNENHELLQQVGVSIQALDDLVEIAMKNGALGAKLTGGGGGGCMIALAKNVQSQQKILQSMIDSGFHGYTTSIGSK